MATLEKTPTPHKPPPSSFSSSIHPCIMHSFFSSPVPPPPSFCPILPSKPKHLKLFFLLGLCVWVVGWVGGLSALQKEGFFNFDGEGENFVWK